MLVRQHDDALAGSNRPQSGLARESIEKKSLILITLGIIWRAHSQRTSLRASQNNDNNSKQAKLYARCKRDCPFAFSFSKKNKRRKG